MNCTIKRSFSNEPVTKPKPTNQNVSHHGQDIAEAAEAAKKQRMNIRKRMVV